MKRNGKKNEFYAFFYINPEIKKSFLMMKENMQAMQQMMKPFKEMEKKWKETLEKLSIVGQQIIQVQEYFQEFAKRVAPIIQVQKPLQKFVKRIKKFDEGLAKIEEIQKEIILETGWWFTPSLMEIPVTLIWQALIDYKKGRKNAITNLFKQVYHHNNYHYLKETVKRWRKNPFFESRMETIEDALDAHCRGKYTLSIPALLPIAEGIATEFCKKAGIYVKEDRSKGGKKIKKAIRFKDALEKSLRLDFLLNAIDERIFKDTDQLSKIKPNYRNLLNRHAVLHGIQKNYPTPKNSLQCFMLLDVLSLLKL